MIPPPPPGAPVRGARTGPGASVGAWAAATTITAAAVGSQYFVPPLLPASDVVYTTPAGYLVVYGIPLLAFLLLVGLEPLRGWNRGWRVATVDGLRWFGLYSLLGLFVGIVLLALYERFDPSAVNLLSKQVPILKAASSDVWLYVALSFAVGAIEETIFRGWIFGFWRLERPDRIGSAALLTGVLFAGVHLYYWSTYGAIATIPLVMLALLGTAFALAVGGSGGNLVVVALLHGAFDASSFYSIVNLPAGLALHYGLILAGVAMAIAVAIRPRLRGAPSPPFPEGHTRDPSPPGER
jgi:membrane protease YdiL (CAAX protease family)